MSANSNPNVTVTDIKESGNRAKKRAMKFATQSPTAQIVHTKSAATASPKINASAKLPPRTPASTPITQSPSQKPIPSPLINTLPSDLMDRLNALKKGATPEQQAAIDSAVSDQIAGKRLDVPVNLEMIGSDGKPLKFLGSIKTEKQRGTPEYTIGAWVQDTIWTQLIDGKSNAELRTTDILVQPTVQFMTLEYLSTIHDKVMRIVKLAIDRDRKIANGINHKTSKSPVVMVPLPSSPAPMATAAAATAASKMMQSPRPTGDGFQSHTLLYDNPSRGISYAASVLTQPRDTSAHVLSPAVQNFFPVPNSVNNNNHSHDRKDEKTDMKD